MKYIIQIKRQGNRTSECYWQEFFFEGDNNPSVASVLRALNARTPLVDCSGKESTPIFWECGCMVRKCGACAMRINGIPRLACSTFLNALKVKKIILEPLSKFPVVKDLAVDRSAIFEKLKDIHLWLESDAFITDYAQERCYQSARCLLCGCCLEVCPNFSVSGKFAGAIAPVNTFRVLNEEQDNDHKAKISALYKQFYFERCGKSLSCQNICPAGIPVEELMVRSNAAAIWKKRS